MCHLDYEELTVKWNLIARNACEQCGENWLPTIADPIDLDQWASTVKSNLY